jgi:uncharacterized protein YndB with AHSA1/START domain
MDKHTISHGSFTLERHYPVAPARVFRAWADPAQLKQWAAPADDWDYAVEDFDFRVGGGDRQSFGPRGEEPYKLVSRYDEILDDRRIVFAYSVARGAQRISSSVSSVELIAENGGTRLRITEQGAFFDGFDSAVGRKGGVLHTLTQLDRFLQERSAA